MLLVNSLSRSRAVCLLIGAAIILLAPSAFCTFSIVAVDTATGAIGSAGGSCIANSKIIHDIIEGVGAINTQAFYLSSNQLNAHALMESGLTPDSIIGWLSAHDASNQPQFRQYGVVSLTFGGASASYTGSSNTTWAGHRTGPGYAIQGNILLGPQIVDSIEAAFLNTPGSLEDRLMAAVEAGDVPGADTRCLSCNKPVISAFIKVIHIGDGATPYLYTFVDNSVCTTNPIPILRQQYNAWKALQQADADSSLLTISKTALEGGGNDSAFVLLTPLNYQNNPPNQGITSVTISNSGAGVLSPVTDNGDGTYSAIIHSSLAPGVDQILASVTAGSATVQLNTQPSLFYYLSGDADGNGLITISDAVFLIVYIFSGGPAPNPLDAGDADCNQLITISDAVYLIVYIFSGGPAPCN